jgi:hypothetical protein
MPTPAWNPGTAAVLSILERSHPGPARGEVNVIEGGRRVVGNSGQPGRSVTSMTVVILGRSALPVSFSRVCGTTLGRGTASGCACQRHAWTTRSRTRTMLDGGRLLITDRGRWQLGVSLRTVERLVAASRPSKREARLTTCVSYPPIGLEGWAASDPDSPLAGSAAALRRSPARRTNGHTALTTVAHRFHLTSAICPGSRLLPDT